MGFSLIILEINAGDTYFWSDVYELINNIYYVSKMFTKNKESFTIGKGIKFSLEH